IAAGTALSATIGGISLLLGHVTTADQFGDVWRTWWLGDASGALVVVPLALAWALHPQRFAWKPSRMAEALAMLTSIAAVSEIVLHSRGRLLYLVFPLLLWAA